VRKNSYKDSRISEISVADALIQAQNAIASNAGNPELLKQLKTQLQQSIKQIDQLLAEKSGAEIVLPVSIFKSDISALEIISAYLKDVKSLKFSDIAKLLNRDDRTIWHAYKRAQSKNVQLDTTSASITVPISVFSNRNYAPLEVLVTYLKDSQKLSLTEIGRLLSRSIKTVWTAYDRAQKKVNHE